MISHNQQGGITAHTVNTGLPARHVDFLIGQELDNVLIVHKGKQIVISAVSGDVEAFQFATEIKQYLQSKEWIVEGVNQVVYTKPAFGQSLVLGKDGKLHFIIGARNPNDFQQ